VLPLWFAERALNDVDVRGSAINGRALLRTPQVVLAGVPSVLVRRTLTTASSMKRGEMEGGVWVVAASGNAEGARGWTLPLPALPFCQGQMMSRAGERGFEAVGTGVGGRVRAGMTRGKVEANMAMGARAGAWRGR